jgi:hypothetical protein
MSTIENGLSLEAVVTLAVMGGWFLAIVLLMFGSLVARRLLLWMLLWTFLASFLPPWGQAVFAVVAGLMVLQGFGALLLGKHAADTMVGNLAADLVRFVFKMIILPLRIVRRLLTWGL